MRCKSVSSTRDPKVEPNCAEATVTAIHDLLDAAVASGEFLGLSYVAVHRDDVLYSGAHGVRSFGITGSPMTVETAGFLASMTKLMTAVAAMQLVEQGMIELDDDVANIVPDLGKQRVLVTFDAGTKQSIYEDRKSKITLRHLLTHTSGLAYDFMHETLGQWAVAEEKFGQFFASEWAACIRPLVFEPGTSWEYGLGLDWVGKIIESLSGQSLEDYMQQRIWTPTGMRNTTFRPEQRQNYQMLEMATRAEDGELAASPSYNLWPIPTKSELGGVGLYSTAEDYAKLLAALLCDGALLSSESLQELCRPQLRKHVKAILTENRRGGLFGIDLPLPLEVNHGLGGLVTEEDVPGRRKKGSICWDGRTNGNWMLDPESGVGCVLLTQVLPGEDAVTKRLWIKLEEEVYKHVDAQNKKYDEDARP